MYMYECFTMCLRMTSAIPFKKKTIYSLYTQNTIEGGLPIVLHSHFQFLKKKKNGEKEEKNQTILL